MNVDVKVAGGGKSGKKVSYPYFTAFISLLNNMELVKQIYLSATHGSLTKELTKGYCLSCFVIHQDLKFTVYFK